MRGGKKGWVKVKGEAGGSGERGGKKGGWVRGSASGEGCRGTGLDAAWRSAGRVGEALHAASDGGLVS